MKQPYRTYINKLLRLQAAARALPLGGLPTPKRRAGRKRAPRVLIFSPHPDDECIVGGIALRLQREARWRVVNVAVTQGSRKDRQAERLYELDAACRYLGFDLVTTGPCGLEGVNRNTREMEPAKWGEMVQVIAEILTSHAPTAILVPHESDWNSTHVGTHLLVMDALAQCPKLRCFVAETEYWGAMTTPNLMVEVGPREIADLMAALSFHVGEVRRNPYHLSLPAWMQDSVRRGVEVVGGQGSAAPDFPFATLYRMRRWNGAALEAVFEGGRIVSASQSIETLFE